MEEPALHLVQAFVAVVKHHSFAKAAQELKMTPSSVSRLVKTLESQIGILLINRTTRAMSLTDAGQRYFSDSTTALEQLRQAHQRARNEGDLPSGTLKLSISVSFGRYHVVPHLAAFLSAYPHLQLDLLMTDRYVDIVAEGVAVAIRIGTLPDSTLIARKLLNNRRILVAAPDYLEKHGAPAGIEALKQHECVVSTASHDGELWRLFGPEGEHAFRPRGRMRADNGDAVHQLAIDGQGIAFHSAVTMSESMRQGKLVQILPRWTGKETGVYCVFPSRHIGPAAKAFVDFLVTRWSGGTSATLAGHTPGDHAPVIATR